MPYRSRIKTLEESIRMIDEQISKETDVSKRYSLQEKKDLYNKELRLMIRAQWDNDHNTVDFGDDL
jgi:hypothetical protein